MNTPTVTLGGFDLATNAVGVDLRAILAGVDFLSPIRDSETSEVIGEGPGVECHSAPPQPDCATLFANFGVDMASGTSTAAANHAFVKR